MIDYRNQSLEQGIFELPDYETYSRIPALTSSSIKAMRKTPAHFKHYIENKVDDPSPAMVVGKAFDLAMLRPDHFETRVVADETKLNRNTTKFKEWAKKVEDSGGFYLPAKGDKTTRADIVKMVEQVKQKRSVAELLDDGYPARTIVWYDDEYGLWCKGEIDWLTTSGIVCDVKKAMDAGFFAFSRQARRLGYDIQAAWYLRGLTKITGYRHEQFRWIVAENTPPFESQVYAISPRVLMDAQARIDELVLKIRTCLETGEYPGYPDHPIDLESGQQIYDDTLLDTDEYADGF